MKKFAWLTFCTGISLSSIAGFYSVIGLAMIFSGAFWPVVMLASILELAKLVSVSWLYRYRHLAGRLLRVYFFAAVMVLMGVTSMGIFGYLTRAHVESEGSYTTAQLTLQEIQQREQQLRGERDQVNSELKALSEQSSQLLTQLSAAQRLRGSQGAVVVQRENAARRTALLGDMKRLNESLTQVQKERIVTETETNKATADIGPLRYVAQAIYGTDDVNTIRQSVVWLTGILMIVFDPMAIMLLIAANILFTRLADPAPSQPTVSVTTTATTPTLPIPNTPVMPESDENPNSTDVPNHLLRNSSDI